jgi:hypothetical protein
LVPGESHISEIAHVIQLAIAPVFLLSGVGTLLTVLTNRLGRIIDRARIVATQLEGRDEHQRHDNAEELMRLSSRARLINWSINLCTICALLICGVIAALFTGTFVNVDLSRVVALFFITSMLALFLGLLSFLREVVIATRGLRISAYPDVPQEQFAKRRPPIVQE